MILLVYPRAFLQNQSVTPGRTESTQDCGRCGIPSSEGSPAGSQHRKRRMTRTRGPGAGKLIHRHIPGEVLGGTGWYTLYYSLGLRGWKILVLEHAIGTGNAGKSGRSRLRSWSALGEVEPERARPATRKHLSLAGMDTGFLGTTTSQPLQGTKQSAQRGQ